MLSTTLQQKLSRNGHHIDGMMSCMNNLSHVVVINLAG